MQRVWILVGLAAGCGGSRPGTSEALAVSWSLGAGNSNVDCAAVGSLEVRVTATATDGREVVATTPCETGGVRLAIPRGTYRVRAEMLGAHRELTAPSRTMQIDTEPVEVRFQFALDQEQHTVRDGLCGSSGICDLPASCEVFLAELPGV